MNGATIEIIDESLPEQLVLGISPLLALELLNWMLTTTVNGTALGNSEDITNTMDWGDIDSFFAEHICPEQTNFIHEDENGRSITEEVFNSLYLVALHVVTLIEDTVKATTKETHCFVLNTCEVLGNGTIHFSIENY